MPKTEIMSFRILTNIRDKVASKAILKADLEKQGKRTLPENDNDTQPKKRVA